MVSLACILAGTCFGAPPEVIEPGQVAREFRQRAWQHEHGLPAGNRVLALAQTPDGFLWVGTQHGLARFDGRSFVVFDYLNTPELESDDCRYLAADLEGNLWIGTAKHLVRKSPAGFTSFAHRLNPFFGEKLPLCPSPKGGVWVGGHGAVGRIRGDAVALYMQDARQPLGREIILCIAEDAAGQLWIGTSSGLVKFDAQQERFEVECVPAELRGRPIMNLWSSPGGSVWALLAEFAPAPGGPSPRMWIARLSPSQAPSSVQIDEQWLGTGRVGQFLVGDRHETLWLPGEAGGLHRHRKGRTEFLPMLQRGHDDYAISALVDREDNLWVGTGRSGLQCWTAFKVTSHTTREGLAHDNTWSISEARDGSVWVGTDGGVTQFKDGLAVPLKRADGSIHKDVRAVVEDREGDLWIGTMRSLERVRDGVSIPVGLPGEWFEAKIRALWPARDGAMWIGTVRGLTRLQGEARTKYTSADGLGGDEVRAILENRAGDLWVGTLGGGLSRLRNGRFETLTRKQGLSSDNVWALHEDPEGVLWIGTDAGLNRLEAGQITVFTPTQGLPDALVNSVVADDFGRLWVGHDRGVYALDRAQLRAVARQERNFVDAVMFDESDGLPSAETNGQKSYPAACKTRTGQIWFPTTRGVAVIDPGRLEQRPVPPLAAILEMRADGQPISGHVPLAAHSQGKPRNGRVVPAGMIELAPGSARVLEFFYTANTFVAPEKARFKYRLLGLQDNWIGAGTQRHVSFTDLRPGSYRFEVLACNHRGVWQDQGAAMAFRVAPFYYQTWWFYALCGVSGMVLIALGVSWRVRELRLIYEWKRVQALEDQRRQIARDIHDELGASLTHIIQLSTGPGPGGTPVASPAPGSAAQRIATIAGKAVDSIGDIVWANNPEFDTLEDLAAYLREQAAQYFADTRIQGHFDFPETVPVRAVSGWFRRHLLMLLKEALQNVSKHADAREVRLRLAVRDDSLELSVADDGLGFAEDRANPNGHGLANMRQRVRDLGGTIEISSQAGAGTRLRFVVPLSQR
jgi:ligand-binding sensor domain-containing protein/signal transduction histidine kinase